MKETKNYRRLKNQTTPYIELMDALLNWKREYIKPRKIENKELEEIDIRVNILIHKIQVIQNKILKLRRE